MFSCLQFRTGGISEVRHDGDRHWRWRIVKFFHMIVQEFANEGTRSISGVELLYNENMDQFLFLVRVVRALVCSMANDGESRVL